VVSKTAELATVKLLLTGVDDSAVVTAPDAQPVDFSTQIALIDELLADIEEDIGQIGDEQNDLEDQIVRLNSSISSQQAALSAAQEALDLQQNLRRELFQKRTIQENRVNEVSELLARFDLLRHHYQIDLQRLSAIRESGSLLAYIARTHCPVCGAHPDAQHNDENCDGNVEAVVVAATAEIAKIERLLAELEKTVEDLRREGGRVSELLTQTSKDYADAESSIRNAFGPELGAARSAYSALIEERAKADKTLDLFRRREKLEQKKTEILESETEPTQRQSVITGIPDSAAHELSMKIANILKAWNFPGECHVHYDKPSADFVIDGKPRGSRGKGLRAITHAAVNIGLLEYCQEKGLPHPGFAVLDSPLLAYYQPEGEDDQALQGTDLKDRFYDYLIEHHREDSQIIIIENPHPPVAIKDCIALTVFTRNPKLGRFGLL
jgi:predicted  nucleic acid-binding Zn-ribbon protein